MAIELASPPPTLSVQTSNAFIWAIIDIKGTTLSIHIQNFSCVPLPTWPPDLNLSDTFSQVYRYPFPPRFQEWIYRYPSEEDAEHLTLERHLLPFVEWPRDTQSATLRPLETATGGDPENALETLSLVNVIDVGWCEVMEKSLRRWWSIMFYTKHLLSSSFQIFKTTLTTVSKHPPQKTGAVKHNILSCSSCGIAYRYSIV